MSANRPAISIIIPIYNVERYLHDCIKTILEQPFFDFEIILVDDGSTDECGKICDQFVQIDDRIRVIHKRNGGLSSARNAGIEAAIGKYIVFIDPDDLISKEYFYKLYSIAEINHCDAVISGYKTVPTHSEIVPGFKLSAVMNGKDLILSAPNIHSHNDLCFVWRYFYSLRVIKENNIRFNEQVFIGEDVIFNLEFLLNSTRVIALPEILYFYTVNNPNSLMRVRYKPKLESSLILQYKARKDLSMQSGLLKHKHYRKDMAYYYMYQIYSFMMNNLNNSEKKNIDEDIRRVVNYEMFSDSIKELGFTYRCNSVKEYIYLLAVRFKIYPLIIAEYKRKGG